MNYLSFFSRVSCVVALTIFGVSSANAQATGPSTGPISAVPTGTQGFVTTDILNDSFADGSRLNSGAPLEGEFFTTSSLGGLDDTAGPAGALDFASGSSGRGIHTLFTPQTLINAGDRITASITFNAPATVGADEDFRFGLFDTTTSPGFTGTIIDDSGFIPIDTGEPLNPMGLAGDIQSSSVQLEPGLNFDGFTTEFEINAPVDAMGENSGDFNVRVQDPTPGNRSGRLLGTTGGFSSIGDSDNFFAQNINPGDTDLTAEVSIELLVDGTVQVTSSFAGEVYEVVDFVEDADGDGNPDATTGVPSFLTGTTFDLLAIGVSSDAFGVSNIVGDADNGPEITNVTVSFTEIGDVSDVPEPGSAMLLLAGLGSLGLIRRRK